MKNKIKMLISVLLVCVMLINTCSSVQAVSPPYLIKINKQMNTVTVYKKDKSGKYTIPIKAMVASCGVDTPIGTFKTPSKYRWRELLGPSYGQYSTRITGSILFHSVWYYKIDPSTLSIKQYNRLGTTASHGCVRLTVEDAKWIYDNCPLGTTVIIYNSSNPGPLGKPKAQKINTSIAWDPTDPDPSNPYNKMVTTISGAKNKTIELGTSNYKKIILQGVMAKDKVSNDITNDIKLTTTVNIKKVGTYNATYEVTANNITAKKNVKIKVVDTTKPQIKGVPTKTKYVKSLNSKVALKGVKATDSSGTAKLSITFSPSVKGDGTYKAKYTATDSSGNKSYKTSTFILDTTSPEITLTNENDMLVKENDDIMNDTYWLSKVQAADNLSGVSELYVASISSYDNTYEVTYSATDKTGNETIVIYIFTKQKEMVEYDE